MTNATHKNKPEKKALEGKKNRPSWKAIHPRELTSSGLDRSIDETLIIKKGKNITTKPIAGTLKKNKFTNKSTALKFFKNNVKETKEHNIFVDMERNYLSRLFKPGSVII